MQKVFSSSLWVSLSTYDLSTLYTILPNNLIKKQFLIWLSRPRKDTQKGRSSDLACNDKEAFFTSTDHRRYKHACVHTFKHEYL